MKALHEYVLKILYIHDMTVCVCVFILKDKSIKLNNLYYVWDVAFCNLFLDICNINSSFFSSLL